LSLPASLADTLGALEAMPMIAALRDSAFAYPIVNALHIIGIALLFGAIVPLDLRLAGWRQQRIPLDALAASLLPVAIFGLLLAICAGLLLFATDARSYAASPLFRAKMVVLAAAIVNALALRAADWRAPAPTGARIKLAAVASILLWLAVILLGRMIGYF
jgi:hypothetical protein